jgi:hypothetical protein
MRFTEFVKCYFIIDWNSHGAEVNAKDNAGKTALYYAVQQDFREIAELLRQHGGRE